MAVSLFLYESNIVPLQVELGGEDNGRTHDEKGSSLLRLLLCVTQEILGQMCCFSV